MSNFPSFKGKLIASGNNAKTVKGDDVYVTAIMYLAPFTSSGLGNVCAMAATAKCAEGCLNTAGRGAMNAVQRGRLRKTKLYMQHRETFLAQLVEDLYRFERWCAVKGVKPAVRLNGTSDIMWEKGHPVYREGIRFANVFDAFPFIQFYDYTKIYTRVDKVLPSNYSLTLSYSGANPDYSREVLNRLYEAKANVAVVYRSRARVEEELRDSHHVIDGDVTDMRFLDPEPLHIGRVVALYAKGKAKHDTSGFVVD